MHACIRGLVAGTAATALLASLLWLNAALGPLREFDLATLIARVLGESRGTGWLLLALIGSVGFGLALAALVDEEERALPWQPALTLSGSGWLAVMMGLLPMAGHAPFGAGMGLSVPLLSLAWAGAYGAALAAAWTWLPRLPELWQHWKRSAAPTAPQGS